MSGQTMPWHGWLEEVLLTAKVTVEELAPFRAMVQRWYQAGEPAWMAADSLGIVVREKARAIRIEEMSRKDSISNAVKASLRVIEERATAEEVSRG